MLCCSVLLRRVRNILPSFCSLWRSSESLLFAESWALTPTRVLHRLRCCIMECFVSLTFPLWSRLSPLLFVFLSAASDNRDGETCRSVNFSARRDEKLSLDRKPENIWKVTSRRHHLCHGCDKSCRSVLIVVVWGIFTKNSSQRLQPFCSSTKLCGFDHANVHNERCLTHPPSTRLNLIEVFEASTI